MNMPGTREGIRAEIKGTLRRFHVRLCFVKPRVNWRDFNHPGDILIGEAIFSHRPIDATKDEWNGVIFIKWHNDILRRIVVGGNDHIRLPRIDQGFGLKCFLPNIALVFVALGVHIELPELTLIPNGGSNPPLDTIRPCIALVIRRNKQALGDTGRLRQEAETQPQQRMEEPTLPVAG